ncbi:response regulator [Rhizobium cauense]|uniref:response regulator n=1 Tax=Rhizobium cauense TaxID=1166683 RepID=UPI001C6E9A20|nr:response regulator [Rhizobium cauense]MBW9114788.1 response regulator [Rhizobium cauense]
MRTLIVEDEMLLAMELESEIEASSHQVIGIAGNYEEAIQLIDQGSPEFAFVDIQLRDGPTGIDIGRKLSSKSIPFVFVSGNLKRIPSDYAGALGAIEKPYTINGLKNALSYVDAVVSGSRPPSPPPSLLVFEPPGESDAEVTSRQRQSGAAA